MPNWSVRLFGFVRKVRGAAEKIDLISKEIAATGALLQQFSQQLDKDSQVQILRSELVESAHELVQKCRKIFGNIDQAIDGNSGNKFISSSKQKIHYTYLEAEVDALRMNLESLKSSIGIMQNLLIYVEQLRNRERFPVLKEQQDLLKALGEEKLDNEQRHNNLMKALKERSDYQPMASPFTSLISSQPSTAHIPLEARPKHLVGEGLRSSQQSHLPTFSEDRIAPDHHRLRVYNSLVVNMLEEVHAKQYILDSSLCSRFHDGVLDLHWREWSRLRQYCDDDGLLKEFIDFPPITHF